jgi:outer membrane lipoprotein-sorting protein
MFSMRRCTLVSLLVCACFSLARAETLDEIEKIIDLKVGSYASYSMRINDQTAVKRGGKSEGETLIEFSRKGGKARFHTENRVEQDLQFGEARQKGKSSTIIVCDGDTVFTLRDADGARTATKQKITPETAKFMQDNPITFFKQTFKLKLAADETIDGKKCWTVECSPTERIPGMDRIVLYIDKQSGFTLKSISRDSTLDLETTTTTSDLKINPDIAEDRFTFKAPDGVAVTDLNK